MAQIEITDALHAALVKMAECIDVTPGHLLSRMLFGQIKKSQLTPQERAAINADHAKVQSAPTLPPTV